MHHKQQSRRENDDDDDNDDGLPDSTVGGDTGKATWWQWSVPSLPQLPEILLWVHLYQPSGDLPFPWIVHTFPGKDSILSLIVPQGRAVSGRRRVRKDKCNRRNKSESIPSEGGLRLPWATVMEQASIWLGGHPQSIVSLGSHLCVCSVETGGHIPGR